MPGALYNDEHTCTDWYHLNCTRGHVVQVIHMGDHAYNEGENDERRADGYMSAWQPALANGVWMPIVGNHEFYSGAELGRFLNQVRCCA